VDCEKRKYELLDWLTTAEPSAQLIIVVEGIPHPITVGSLTQIIRQIPLPDYVNEKAAKNDGLAQNDQFRLSRRNKGGIPGTVIQIL